MSEFKIDIDEKKIKLNPLVDGSLRGLIVKGENFVNSYDGINHNGIPDVQEVHDLAVAVIPKVMTAVPKIAALSAAIDFEEMAADISGKPWVKDQALLVKTLKELGALAEDCGQLVEKAAGFILIKE